MAHRSENFSAVFSQLVVYKIGGYFWQLFIQSGIDGEVGRSVTYI